MHNGSWVSFCVGQWVMGDPLFILLYSLGHGLCTFTAVPTSTRSSTLRPGTVK